MFLISLMMLKLGIAQVLIKQPQNTHVSLGQTIVLSCSIDDYSNEIDTIEWCKNGFCTWGRPRELADGRLQFKSLSRYFIVGNRARGEWNLQIESVASSDEGEYKCQVTRRNDIKNVKMESNVALVRLLREPSNPVLNKVDSIQIIYGQMETLKCTVYDGVPEPLIRWQLNDGTLLNKYSKLTQKFDKVNVYESSLNIHGALEYENKSISCLVEHPTLSETFETSIKIDLKYPPILMLYHEPNEELIEGKTYSFHCKQKSLPKTQDVSIEFDKKRVLNEPLLITMTRSLNTHVIKCESENEIGKSSINRTLNIIYSPKFTTRPDEILITKRGESIVLTCEVDSNPQTEITWLRNNKDLIEFGRELHLSSVNTSGEYTCQAKNAHFNAITSSSSIIVEGPPTILGDKNIYSTKRDNDLNVEFMIFTSVAYQEQPKCKRLTSTQQIELTQTEKYKLTEIYDKENKRLSSKYLLSLKKLNENDLGIYSCSIENQYGINEYSFEVNFKSDNKSFLIITLASILSVLFVLIVLLSVSLVICKRRLRSSSKYCKRKPLPSVVDDASHQSTISNTSPNLSVSEWMKHSSHTYTVHDDHSSENSSSSQKNLLSEHHSLSTNTTDLAMISPSLLFVRNDNGMYSNYERFGNIYAKSSNYQSADILSSRFQTIV